MFRYVKVLFVFFLVCGFFSFNVSAISDYISSPSPSDGEDEISYVDDVTTCVSVDGIPQGCHMNLSFYENSSGSWVEYESFLDIEEKGSFCGNLSVSCGETVYWMVIGNISCGRDYFIESHVYIFDTIDCPVSHVYPSNNSINNCPCCLSICAKLTNLSGDTIKFAFQSNYTGSWQNLEDSRIVPSNHSYCICVPEFVWYNYTYYWRVIYNDGSGSNSSDIFSFTTAEHADDCPCGEGNTVFVDEDFMYMFLIIIGLIFLFGSIGISRTLGKSKDK